MYNSIIICKFAWEKESVRISFYVKKMIDKRDFIFTDDLHKAFSDNYSGYCLHIVCLEGSARFEIGEQLFNLVAGEVMIKSTGKAVRNLSCSDDLKTECLLITMDYLQREQPKSDYQIIGTMATLEHPVFPVSANDIEQIRHDFHEISRRLGQRYNNFFDNIVRREVDIMIFDFFDMHSRSYNVKLSGQHRASEILSHFVSLLQKGLYKENRSVAYFASLIFISPKYLSEACTSASGYNASYWIDRYTVDAISHELLDTEKTLQQIADEYHFSSVSYFSRYVKEHLHASPAGYRKKSDNGKDKQNRKK